MAIHERKDSRLGWPWEWPLLIQLAVLYLIFEIGGGWKMITLVSGLLSLSASFAPQLVAGWATGMAGGSLIPWLTRAHRARKAVRMMRKARQHLGHGELDPAEVAAIEKFSN